MSNGSLIDEATPRPQNDLRTLAMVGGVVAGAILLLYFLVGKSFFETRRLAEENKQKSDQVWKTQEALQQQGARAESQLKVLKNELGRSLDGQERDLSIVLPRLLEIEKQMQAMLDTIDPLLNMAQKQKAEDASHAADIADAFVLGQNVEKIVSDLRANFDAFQADCKQLLTNERGRKIATDPDLVQRFWALVESTPVTEEDIHRFEVRLDELLPVIEEAHNDDSSNSTIDPKQIADLTSIAKPARVFVRSLELHRIAISQIAEQASTANAGANSLESAVKECQKRTAERMSIEQVAILNSYRDKAMDERAEKVGKAEYERIAAETAAEVEKENKRKKQADLDANQHRQDVKQMQRLADAEKLKREFQRDLPEIRSLLTPFISPGTSQPGFSATGENRYEIIKRTLNRRSVSLSALRGAQMLTAGDEDSLKRLYIFGGNGGYSRSPGGFPALKEGAFKQTKSVRESVKRAQELLIKYGDLMVEQGLLNR